MSRPRIPATNRLRPLGAALALAAAAWSCSGEPTRGAAWPVQVQTVSAGYDHSCGLGSDGRAYCWGDGWFGQLGSGDTAGSLTPVAVPGGLSFTQVVAGSTSSCGIASNGIAYCWGSGALGTDSAGANRTPAPVAGGIAFRSLSTGAPLLGGSTVCGVATGGAAYCWGANADGQLGDSSWTDRRTPVAVAGGLTFTAIATGGASSCGLTAGGAAYCWGRAGQLGDTASTARYGSTTPVPVAGGSAFATLSVGFGHACGVTASRAAYCWGHNGSGQLGNGSDSAAAMPVAVSGDLTFTALSAGYAHTCGLTADGAAWCWGDNSSAQLGDGTTTSRRSPVRVQGGVAFSAISAGYAHTCGVTRSGLAYCWGDNFYGKLGDGTTTARDQPMQVTLFP